MKRLRFFFLALFTLALLAACSQPADLPTAELEPQFGTADDDYAYEVATHPKHPYVFVAGTRMNEVDSPDHYRRGFLRRYNRDGTLVWERLTPRARFVRGAEIGGVGTDAAGNVYAIYAGDVDPDPFQDLWERYLVKFDKDGTQLWRKMLSPSSYSVLAVDGDGSVYVGSSEGGAWLQKYTSAGRLVWERGSSSNAWVTDVALSPAGDAYVLIDNRFNSPEGPGHLLQKYNPNGQLQFERKIFWRSEVQGIAFGLSLIHI